MLKFSELNDFYDRVFGRDPKEARFKLTPRKRELYHAQGKNDARGFASQELDEERVIATMVMALHFTRLPGEKEHHPVVLAVPKAFDLWSYEISKQLYQHILRRFRGEVAIQKDIRSAFSSVFWEHRVFNLPQEPDRWVAYGFRDCPLRGNDDSPSRGDDLIAPCGGTSNPVPKWMEGRLIVPRR